MGILHQPREKEISGPWLLGLKELEELDTIIHFIDNKLSISHNLELRAEAEKDLQDGRFDSINKALEANSKFSFGRQKVKKITVISKDEIKITDESLKNILIDSQIKNFSPKELNITIEYGFENTFTLNIRKRFDGDLTYKIKCFDNSIENEINYEIENWVDNNEPNKAAKVWSKYSFPMILISGYIMFTALGKIYSSNRPSTLTYYQTEIADLLKVGIDSSNQYGAIELLLKLNTNYLPLEVQPIEEISYTSIKVSVFSLLLMIVLLIKPRTTIGLGRHKNKVKLYKNYIKFVLISVPAIFFLPILYGIIMNFFAT